MSRGTGGAVAQLVDFNPARWASQATRDIDLGDSISALVAVLSSTDRWEATIEDAPARRALVHDCAAALRGTAPLFELTAALIAPWLVESRGNLSPAGGTFSHEVVAASNRLTILTRHLFETPGLLDFDPWAG